MEKFTVDLDKVLDDFEFTEEQAVKQSQYINEDLPAKKYQKPQFQRINLADADFSPAKQTTSPYPIFEQKGDNVNPVDGVVSVLETQEVSAVPDLLGGDVPEIDNQSITHLPDLTETGSDSKQLVDLISGASCDSPSESEQVISESSKNVIADTNALILAIDTISSSFNENFELPNDESTASDIVLEDEKHEVLNVDDDNEVLTTYSHQLEVSEIEDIPSPISETCDPEIDNKINEEIIRPTTLDLPEQMHDEENVEKERPEISANEITKESSQNLDASGTSSETTEEDVVESVDSESSVEHSSVTVPEERPSAALPVSTEADPYPSPSTPSLEERRLGKVSPFWVPDSDATNCMHCGDKFTVIKRRHHCRACGRVLCSRCCRMRAQLEYLHNQEQRVCEGCFQTLAKVMVYELESESESETSPRRRPNPNNPMEYCSTVPPPLQAQTTTGQPPPSVLVPVLKREGANRNKESMKKVMFSDGIRPGGDLTSLDEPSLSSRRSRHHRIISPPGSLQPSPVHNLPPMDPSNQSFVIDNSTLPPLCTVNKGTTSYHDAYESNDKLIQRLSQKDEPALTFAVNRYLVVSLKIVTLDCCMKQTCWLFVTNGMSAVGQDEIVLLLQKPDDEVTVPAEIFLIFHYIYKSASEGDALGELGFWDVKTPKFLDSRQHGGFLFIRPTSQCLQNIDKPPAPFLVAILIHRLELPWARLFPLRLMLRLGAEYRYYPCSLVSVRFREPVYFEIGQTIINLLADFRNFSYTLPPVRGLKIHKEDNGTKIFIPKNRYNQIVRALNNSDDPVLALAGNFSKSADSHLVCMQNSGDEVTYHTQTITIKGQPRKVTGMSFVLFNASLKRKVGVIAKARIVEDGLMIQISSETMADLRGKLRAMQDWSVSIGTDIKETIDVVWSEDDLDFNIGVVSIIDGRKMDGVPSIRMHCGNEVMGHNRFIRWTEVFILQCHETIKNEKLGDPPEIHHLAASIAQATCTALIKFLDMLASSNICKLAVRVTINQDEVSYEAGGNGEKLPPVYMNSLDSKLIPVLHKAVSANGDSTTVLEDVFHIFNKY